MSYPSEVRRLGQCVRFAGNSVKLSRTPCRCAYNPVRMEARLGEQSEVVQNMFSNRTPSLEIRSIWGVFNAGCPAQLMAFQRISSQRMKSTFGLFSAAKPLEQVKIEVVAPIQKTRAIGGNSFDFISKNLISHHAAYRSNTQRLNFWNHSSSISRCLV